MINHMYNVEKMYTYLRGFLVGAGMDQGIQALNFARKKHAGQLRKDGTPYIAHPLQMACYAAALGMRHDEIMAGILLHDVCEDCEVPVELLPVNNHVKEIVKRLTIEPLESESKAETKERYFRELLLCKEAVIIKGLDRYHNMSSMAGVLSDEAVSKNIRENNELLLSMLKQAKDLYPELSDILFVLRTNISSVSKTLETMQRIAQNDAKEKKKDEETGKEN